MTGEGQNVISDGKGASVADVEKCERQEGSAVGRAPPNWNTVPDEGNRAREEAQEVGLVREGIEGSRRRKIVPGKMPQSGMRGAERGQLGRERATKVGRGRKEGGIQEE